VPDLARAYGERGTRTYTSGRFRNLNEEEEARLSWTEGE
jgi:hypothetical protein